MHAGDSVLVTIGAGGIAPSAGYSTSLAGENGSGGAAGGAKVSQAGQGAISVYGSGNSGGNYFLANDSNYGTLSASGTGGSNGTPYGGGGGGSIGNHNGLISANAPIFSASGGGNGKAGASIFVRDNTYTKGGDGGDGAVIVEYYDPKKK